MELKEVLHFYLGCEVMYKGEIHFLSGISRPYKTNDKTLPTFSVRPNDKGFRDTIFSLEDFDNVKLILRPLPSMTDKEIDEIASILLGKETHCYEKWRAKEGDCIIAEWKKEKPLLHAETYDSLTMGMLIRADFTIDHQWNYHNAKGTGVTHEPLPNHNKITAYLLSKGFDVFSLIESGKAIDATTLTQQQ